MQVPSIKLLLRTSKVNALGQHPIYLRITAQRKTSFISCGYSVAAKYWDEAAEQVRETHLLHKEINESILNRKKQVMDDVLTASIARKSVTAKGLKEGSKKEWRNFFSFADDFTKTVKEKRAGATIENYEKHLRKLEEYHGSRVLSFEEITVDFLNSFEQYLRDNVATREGGDSSGYIEAIMRTLRMFFNAARKRHITDNYPFALYEMPETKAGGKAHLTQKEIEAWHQYTFETEHKTLKQSALYFLFACYTGLRLSDWKDFADSKMAKDNISLKAAKNKAWIAVPLHRKLLEVIELMRKIPLDIAEPTINRHLKKIAKHLKINKSLSTHSGRKSFAVTMCLERGISAETAAKLMGITLAVFEKNYSYITKEKIMLETAKAWKDL